MAHKADDLKIENEHPFREDKEDADFISYDAPPLDFSFKNIKHVSGTFPLIQNSNRSSPDRGRRKAQPPKKTKANFHRNKNWRGNLKMSSTEAIRKKTKRLNYCPKTPWAASSVEWSPILQ